MDVREKLVELLKTSPTRNGYTDIEDIADHLIANGVTVQKWISVDDRLPEKDEVVIIYTDRDFIYAGELIGDTWFLDYDNWTETVTHWMPLPNPPKGE